MEEEVDDDDDDNDKDDEGEDTDEELDDSEMDEEDNSGSKKGDKVNKNNAQWAGHDSVEEKKSDVDEMKTVFVRNLDFSTNEESFKDYMTTFGPIHYALLCMDRVMERPKGTGFVKFRVSFHKLSVLSCN